MKKTEWFPADVNPVRPGVYRVEKSYGEAWAKFDGKRWSHGIQSHTSPASHAFTNYRGAYPIKQWRGLAKQPQ